MKNKKATYQSKSLHDILTSYPFPHRFLVYFASQCAKDALSKVKYTKGQGPDPRTLTAIDITERFGNGEEFTPEFLEKTYKDAYAAANATADAAYDAAYADAANATAANAANAAATAAAYAATSAASTAATAATYTAANGNAEHYKPLLLSLIETRLSEVERVLMLS